MGICWSSGSPARSAMSSVFPWNALPKNSKLGEETRPWTSGPAAFRFIPSFIMFFILPSLSPPHDSGEMKFGIKDTIKNTTKRMGNSLCLSLYHVLYPPFIISTSRFGGDEVWDKGHDKEHDKA